MELQANLLAVNTLPPVLAARWPEAKPEVEREEIPAEPVTPIINGFYISPLLRFDNQALALIFQVRDSETGEVQRQFPRESAIERLRANPDAQAIRIVVEGGEEVVQREARPVDPEASPVDPEAPPPPLIGTGGADRADAAGTAETDTVGVVGGTEVANGAPAIGGTSTGVAAGLGPSNQGVDFLV